MYSGGCIMYYLFDQTFPFLAHVPSCPRALPTAAVPAKSVKYKVFFSTAAPCGGPRMCVLNINSECTTKLYHRGGGVLQDRLQYRRSTVYAWCGESISRHGTANRGAASKLVSSSKVRFLVLLCVLPKGSSFHGVFLALMLKMQMCGSVSITMAGSSERNTLIWYSNKCRSSRLRCLELMPGEPSQTI